MPGSQRAQLTVTELLGALAASVTMSVAPVQVVALPKLQQGGVLPLVAQFWNMAAIFSFFVVRLPGAPAVSAG